MSKSRAIFEEVGERTAPPKAPSPGAADRAKRRGRRAVAWWLYALAALVVAMVLVGGMTRLTESGLSMVSWNPVLGAIPPMTEADWLVEFEKYQQTAQFRLANHWMALEDFKPIYWWEWGHRQFGRVIGLVWAVGFLVFTALRMIPRGYWLAVIAPGALGGVQAVIGMWMVDSGVSPDSELVSVAPYRLATHLGLAFVILGLLVWPAWKLWREDWELLQARRRRSGPVLTLSGVFVFVGFAQMILGALVAGNDAGRGYIDWPLMDGHILPPESFEITPLWRNFIENDALTQFNHRVLGYALALFAVVYWTVARRSGLAGIGKWAAFAVLTIWLQMGWGVITVMNGAALNLAFVHQAGGLLSFALMLRARFEAAYPAEQSLRNIRPSPSSPY